MSVFSQRTRPHAAAPRGLCGFVTATLIGAAALLTPAALSAQALAIQVRDSVRAIGEATVTVLNGGDVVARAVTDGAGIARASGLPVGTLVLRVEALGYEPRTVEGVELRPGQVRAVDVLLTLKAVEVEGLTVEAGRIQIQRRDTEFSTQVEERTIQLMPVTYDAHNLIALTPGARPNNVWGGANFQANSYRVDGVSANHPGTGGDLLQPNINWIDKIEVRGLGSGAEYGGFQGGLIDVITKSGDNNRQGFIRTAYQNDLLASSNLVSTEIGREVSQRVDLEGEVRGPLIRDQLFYYASAKRVQQNSQALNHLDKQARYLPFQEEQQESKLFGKLTWTPTPSRRFEVSGAFTDVRADNYGITGFEGPNGTHRYTAPTTLLNASFTEALSTWGTFDVRVNHFSRDERHDPYGGEDVPGVRTFALSPPFTSFGNAPFTLRSSPTSTSGNAQLNIHVPSGSLDHTLKIGAEYTRGSFLDLRHRNGGVTWLATASSRFDPGDPSTWSHLTSKWVPSEWGGEVNLDADASNSAVFAQSSIALGHRVVLSPGLRWNEWRGWLTPMSGDRFQAIQAHGWDPRVGISVDLAGDGTLVAKGHWGRYHQSLISQMFDRVGGSDVFTDQETWWYTPGDLTDPTTTFTEPQRDALAQSNIFRKLGKETLNETGPVQDYRQPYIDQWLVALEKQVGSWMKVQALYTRRSNRDMVALVDLNRKTNYSLFKNVRVFNTGGGVVPFSGGSVLLKQFWVPNGVIAERLRCLHFADCPDALPVPGFQYRALSTLTWDPQFVVTTAPDAKREFGQLQLSMEISRPAWGASLSWVKTDLAGNLDNVSGYTDPQGYDAGPYVRVNEAVNAYGLLENFSDQELKLSIWGTLPWDLRGGAFFTHQSGDHYSPKFRLYGLGFFSYKVGTGALQQGGIPQYPGEEIDYQLLTELEGHELFVGPRGRPTLPGRSNLDLRLERLFAYRGRDLSITMDVFNVFRNRAITQLNTMVNNGPDYGFPVSYSLFSPGISPNQYYQAPQERVAPRALRVGVAFYF